MPEQPDRPILHEESTGPLRSHTCAGCGKPWPVLLPLGQWSVRAEWRMDEGVDRD
jgi:hypothetical protein